MKRLVLAWDNSCDRCKLAVTVTAQTVPALGTHARAQCAHPPWHPREKDLLLLLGISSSSPGDMERPGEQAGVSEGALLSQGMASARVASVRALPGRGEAVGCALLLPQPAPAVRCCSTPLLGGGRAGATAPGKANSCEVPAVNVVSTAQKSEIVL